MKHIVDQRLSKLITKIDQSHNDLNFLNLSKASIESKTCYIPLCNVEAKDVHHIYYEPELKVGLCKYHHFLAGNYAGWVWFNRGYVSKTKTIPEWKKVENIEDFWLTYPHLVQRQVKNGHGSMAWEFYTSFTRERLSNKTIKEE